MKKISVTFESETKSDIDFMTFCWELININMDTEPDDIFGTAGGMSELLESVDDWIRTMYDILSKEEINQLQIDVKRLQEAIED